MLQATAEVNNLTMVNKCKDKYLAAMDEICSPNKTYMPEGTLDLAHKNAMAEVLESFDSARKLGDEQFTESFRTRLVTEMEKSYEGFKAANEKKIMQSNTKTPIVLLTLALLCYILS